MVTPESLTAWLSSNGWRREAPGVFRSAADCEPDMVNELVYAWHPRDGYISIEVEQVDGSGHHRPLMKHPTHVYNLFELDTVVTFVHRGQLELTRSDIPVSKMADGANTAALQQEKSDSEDQRGQADALSDVKVLLEACRTRYVGTKVDRFVRDWKRAQTAESRGIVGGFRSHSKQSFIR